jgi:hypothetical protein
MKNISLFLSVIMVAFTLGCGDKMKSNSGDGDNKGADVGPLVTKDLIHKFRYFKGGWFGQAGVANWSHDMTFDFLQWDATQQGYKVLAVYPDSLCNKGGFISITEVNSLIDLYGKDQYMSYPDTGPFLADAGVETIEITTSTGLVRTFHLDKTLSLGAGDKYILEPAPIRSFLTGLWDGLPTACQ